MTANEALKVECVSAGCGKLRDFRMRHQESLLEQSGVLRRENHCVALGFQRDDTDV